MPRGWVCSVTPVCARARAGLRPTPNLKDVAYIYNSDHASASIAAVAQPVAKRGRID